MSELIICYETYLSHYFTFQFKKETEKRDEFFSPLLYLNCYDHYYQKIFGSIMLTLKKIFLSFL